MGYDGNVADAVDVEIQAERDDLVRLCAQLVRAASVNPPGRTAEVAQVVREYLSAHGVQNSTVAADDEAPNVVGQVAGARAGRHVVFNAHMDTMEAGDEKSWTVPIFDLTRREGRLYGLGMGNMKGALAAMCVATAVLRRHREAWGGRFSMTAVSDEVMFGDRGTVFLLRTCPELAGDFLISGEGPGFMDFAIAEKGLLWLDIEVSGGGGHSSRAQRGETAVMRLANLLKTIDELNALYAEPPPELAGVSGGEGNAGLRLSLNAGSLFAGTVRSQIATTARTQLDIRLPPGISAAEIERRIRSAAAADPRIKI